MRNSNKQPTGNVHWESWISQEDRAHLDDVQESVLAGVIPASTAFNAINVTQIAAETERSQSTMARILYGVRNIAVLFPIIVTWLSFALASSAYNASLSSSISPSKSVSSSPLIRIPLLEQWERGFTVSTAQLGPFTVSLTLLGGRWFTFSHFASFDGILIFGLVIITLIAQGQEAKAQARAREVTREVEKRLLEIAKNRAAASPEGQTVEERTRFAFEQINQQLKAFGEAVVGFTEAMRDVPVATLEAVSQRLLAFEEAQAAKLQRTVEAVGVSQTAVMEQVRDFVESTDHVATEVNSAFNKLRALWNDLEGVQKGVAGSAQNAAEKALEASRVASQFSATAIELKDAQDRVAGQLEAMSSRYNSSIGALQNIASHFDQATEQQQQIRLIQHALGQQMNAVLAAADTLRTILTYLEELKRNVDTGRPPTPFERLKSLLGL